MLETFTDYVALEMLSPFVGLGIIAAIFLAVSVQERRTSRRARKLDG